MAHHAQGLGRVAGDQNAFALREQVAHKIANGVSFAGARRALYQNASMFLELLSNSNLLGIRGLAQKHFAIGLGPATRGWIHISRRDRRFFSNDIQERPGEILTSAEVCDDALDRRGES
jgi:hypothetical protein